MILSDAKSITIDGKSVKSISIGGRTAWQRDLPAGYTRLAYLQSSGTQYIDTGVVGNSDTTAFEVEIDTTGLTQLYGYPCIIGSRYSAGRDRLYTITQNNYEVTYFGNGTVEGALYQNTQGRHIWSYNADWDKKYREDGVFKLTVDQSFTAPTLWLLNCHYGTNQENRQYVAKLYYAKLWDNGVPIRNMIPALRNFDGKPGLWDTVSKQFFTNVGTGEFTYA